MDKLECYRKIIKETLKPIAAIPYSDPNITMETVFDTAGDHYLIVTTGWEGNTKRVYFNLVHVDIIDGKIWIQYDGTEEGVGYDFERAGVPKEDIVPAFHPVSVRPHTGYGVG